MLSLARGFCCSNDEGHYSCVYLLAYHIKGWFSFIPHGGLGHPLSLVWVARAF